MGKWTLAQAREMIANLELLQEQHSLAITTLRDDIADMNMVLKDHGSNLGRLESKLNAETEALDNHEKRIRDLEN